jgi:hypothetical protein
VASSKGWEFTGGTMFRSAITFDHPPTGTVSVSINVPDGIKYPATGKPPPKSWYFIALSFPSKSCVWLATLTADSRRGMQEADIAFRSRRHTLAEGSQSCSRSRSSLCFMLAMGFGRTRMPNVGYRSSGAFSLLDANVGVIAATVLQAIVYPGFGVRSGVVVLSIFHFRHVGLLC